jgi:alkylation response protein AidB-like acyl-CoA dehydrogenase
MNYDISRVDAARNLIPLLAELAPETEQLRQTSAKGRDAIIEAGLTRLLQPVRFGGGDASLKCFIDVCAELAKGCVSSGWCNFVWGAHNFMIGWFAESCQDRIWAVNPETLTSASIDPAGIATRVDNGFELNGHWRFASGCDHADWLLLGAMLDDGAGPQPHLFAVPKVNVEIVDTWHVSGLKGTGSKDVKAEGSFTYADCAVHFKDSVAPNGALAVLVIAAPILGGAEAAIQRFEERLSTRVTAFQKKQKDQSIALLRLAEVNTAVHAARLVIERAADEIDECLSKAEVLDGNVQVRIMRDAAWAAQQCRHAVDIAFSMSGGSALLDSEPLQRIWRDVNAGGNHARLNWEDFAESWASQRMGHYVA